MLGRPTRTSMKSLTHKPSSTLLRRREKDRLDFESSIDLADLVLCILDGYWSMVEELGCYGYVCLRCLTLKGALAGAGNAGTIFLCVHPPLTLLAFSREIQLNIEGNLDATREPHVSLIETLPIGRWWQHLAHLHCLQPCP